MPRPGSSRLAAPALVAVTAVWGSTFVVVQAAVAVMAVMDFLFWRFALAAVLLLALRPVSLRRLDARDLRRGSILGTVLASSYLLQTVGLQHTEAAVSGFITGMFLVFVPLISAIGLHRPVPASAWLATGLATIGLGLLSVHGLAVGFGELLTLGCAFGFALHLVYLGEWTSAAKAYPLTVIQLGVAGALTGLAGAADGVLELPQDARMWAVVGFMAVFATMGAYLVQSWAMAHIAPVRSAVILTLEPVFAGLFGVLVAGDEVTFRLVAGGGLILAAMYAVELGPRLGRSGAEPTADQHR